MYNEYDENPVHKTLKQRKKKKLKKKVKFGICIVFVMMICAFLLSDYSKVKSMNISGLEMTKEKDILDHISIKQSSFYFLIDKKKVEKEIKEIPTIKDVKVHIDWKGNVNISVNEAMPIAYAKIGNTNYEINDIGNVIEVNHKERINLLKTLIYVDGFKDKELLVQFAKGFKDVPTLMQNEMSDIILDPQPANDTRLKCLMKDDKIIYIKIEDLSTKLNDQFNYEAYKTDAHFKDKCSFSIEGKYVYTEDCKKGE